MYTILGKQFCTQSNEQQINTLPNSPAKLLFFHNSLKVTSLRLLVARVEGELIILYTGRVQSAKVQQV